MNTNIIPHFEIWNLAAVKLLFWCRPYDYYN